MNSTTSYSRTMNGLTDIVADSVTTDTLTISNLSALDIVCNTLNAATSVTTDNLLSNSGILTIGAKVNQSTNGSNVSYGINSMNGTQTGTENTSIGSGSSRNLTTANQTTAVGALALNTSTTGGGNTAIGYRALFANNSVNNTALGSGALSSYTGSAGTAVGYLALTACVNGTSNNAFGLRCLESLVSSSANTGMGQQALRYLTTGQHNTATGFSADINQIGGAYNCFYGSSCGHSVTWGTSFTGNSGYGAFTSPSGNNNTLIGYQAGTGAGRVAVNNSTGLGYLATPTASNQIMLGTITEYTRIDNYLDVGNYIITPTQPPLTNNTRVATTQYVDSAVALIGGVTLAGANVWTGTNSFNTNLPTSTLTPSSGTQLTNKNFVDTKGGLTLSNNWTGLNTFNTNLPTSTQVPSSGSELTNKTFVDTAISNIGLYDNTLTIVDDFLCGLDNTAVRWSAVAGGAAGPFGTFAASEIDHPGIYRLASSITTNGYVGLVMNTASIFTNNLTCVEWVWRYNNNYANIEIHAGYSQGINTFTTSACFRYTGTYYQAVVNGTVVYTFNKNIAIWSGSNLTSRWLYGCININAITGTQQFILSILNLNETDSYTHSAAITSAIVTPICRIRQTGTTSATLDADYCRFKYVSPRL